MEKDIEYWKRLHLEELKRNENLHDIIREYEAFMSDKDLDLKDFHDWQKLSQSSKNQREE